MQRKQRESKLSTAISTFSTFMLIIMFIAVFVQKNEHVYENNNRSFENVMADLSLDTEDYNEEELKCLRKAIFFEVRKNIKKEMQVVGNVVLNRVNDKRFPNTICGVVLHKGQFEYVMRGLHDKEQVEKLVNKSVLEKQSWETASQVAMELLTGEFKDKTNGATAYHANTMNKPNSRYWNSLKQTVKTDLHVFYK
jgi:spore germination cell wall hydrolase CwlJ-like protein